MKLGGRCWRQSRRFAAGLALLAVTAAPRADAPPAGPLLRDTAFVIFDVETTGLSVRKDRVVEIAAVRFRAGAAGESRSWLVHPGIPIPEPARAVHGITDAMVAGAAPFERVFEEFEAFAACAVLVAHNARFDRGVLLAELARAGRPPPPHRVVDSLPLFRARFPGLRAYTLPSLAKHFGLTHEGAHRALGDAACLAALFARAVATWPADAALDDLLEGAGGALNLAP